MAAGLGLFGGGIGVFEATALVLLGFSPGLIISAIALYRSAFSLKLLVLDYS